MKHKVLIIDFGSQYTQLIARRVREQHVYCEIVPYHSALWELFKNYRKVADEEFINWFHVNTNLSLEIDLAMESGKLEPRTSVFSGYSFQDKAQEQRWNYCEEFIRLTNNRLGVHNKNEGYLYYVMAQSLHVLTAPVPNFTKVA